MKDIQIFIRPPGSCPGVGLGGTVGVGGVKKNSGIQPDMVCVSYCHGLHMHRHNFLGPKPLGPWGGVENLIF